MTIHCILKNHPDHIESCVLGGGFEMTPSNTEEKSTPTPWELEISPGFEDDDGNPEAEPYALASVKLFNKNILTKALDYNKETKKWDIPVPYIIAEQSFDDRRESDGGTVVADFKKIQEAVNSNEQLKKLLDEKEREIEEAVNAIKLLHAEFFTHPIENPSLDCWACKIVYKHSAKNSKEEKK